MKNLLTVSACIFLFLFSGCKKQETKSVPAAENTVARAAKLLNLPSQITESLSGKNIFVLLAHNFNDEKSVEDFTKTLDENFGVHSQDTPGLIKILVYPQDFTVSGKVRITSLYTILKDENPAGLVTLGAPEGLCNAIAKLEDTQENSVLPYPVIQLFPQDNILGTEAVSTIVLDYAQTLETSISEETIFQINFNPEEILINSIEEIILERGKILKNRNLLLTVQNILGSKYKVANYIDSETSLQSVNHFIFEKQ